MKFGMDLLLWTDRMHDGMLPIVREELDRLKAHIDHMRKLVAAGGAGTVETTSRDLSDRDRRDRTRSVDPLVPAGDARLIDTSALSPDQVVEQMIAAVSTGS